VLRIDYLGTVHVWYLYSIGNLGGSWRTVGLSWDGRGDGREGRRQSGFQTACGSGRALPWAQASATCRGPPLPYPRPLPRSRGRRPWGEVTSCGHSSFSCIYRRGQVLPRGSPRESGTPRPLDHRRAYLRGGRRTRTAHSGWACRAPTALALRQAARGAPPLSRTGCDSAHGGWTWRQLPTPTGGPSEAPCALVLTRSRRRRLQEHRHWVPPRRRPPGVVGHRPPITYHPIGATPCARSWRHSSGRFWMPLAVQGVVWQGGRRGCEKRTRHCDGRLLSSSHSWRVRARQAALAAVAVAAAAAARWRRRPLLGRHC
jgi:hypothetical protein